MPEKPQAVAEGRNEVDDTMTVTTDAIPPLGMRSQPLLQLRTSVVIAPEIAGDTTTIDNVVVGFGVGGGVLGLPLTSIDLSRSLLRSLRTDPYHERPSDEY